MNQRDVLGRARDSERNRERHLAGARWTEGKRRHTSPWQVQAGREGAARAVVATGAVQVWEVGGVQLHLRGAEVTCVLGAAGGKRKAATCFLHDDPIVRDW